VIFIVFLDCFVVYLKGQEVHRDTLFFMDEFFLTVFLEGIYAASIKIID
jgi:hypothetical protein